MTQPDHQTIIKLYECLWETLGIMELENVEVIQVFYCGKSSKWGIPNTLFVVVPDEQVRNNRFYLEMSSIPLTRGSAYLSKKVKGNAWSSQNREYQFSYQVATDLLVAAKPFNEIVDDRWQYRTTQEMIDITQQIFRIHNLRAFL